MRGVTLPGWRSSLRISPLRHSLDLSATQPVHGALSLILGQPHRERIPSFVLVPQRMERHELRDLRDPLWAYRSDEWEVHWLHPAAMPLGETSHRVDLFGALRLVTLGSMGLITIGGPGGPDEGRYSVTLESLTPFIMRRGRDERTQDGHCRMSPGLLIGALHACLKKMVPDQAAHLAGMHLCCGNLAWQHVPFGTGWNNGIRVQLVVGPLAVGKRARW